MIYFKSSLDYLYGEGTGTPLQYSCLENPMDGGAWWAAVHGVVKSRTWLSDFTLTFHFSLSCIGRGNGNPLQCSCLENPRDREAWWAAVSGVAQSQILLKQLSSSSSSNNIVNQFLTRVPRQFSFQQMVLGQLHTHRQKNGTGLLSYTTQKLIAN